MLANDILSYIVTGMSYLLIIFGLTISALKKFVEMLSPLASYIFKKRTGGYLMSLFENQLFIAEQLPDEFPELESNIYEEQHRLFCKEWREHSAWA